ncbi:MAG: hypothetical protein KJ804_16025 [Proteobacteria bacterium]|nr:hypothetical protein [Pseudomonadota bacterium]MBU1059819.1 hypothetical protein [Pseudomonadota bacterium]
MNRSMGAFCTFLFGIVSLQLGSPCQAYNISEGLSINGFLSQGYIKSRHNNFLGNSGSGSWQLNEFALTTNYMATDNLRFGFQLLSRDVGADGNNDILIDWAVADYHWQDWFGLRLGKVKLPIGLYNQGRDIGFLRPMVFLPQSIYDENKRTLVVAALGTSIYGNISFGDNGDLDYQAYYGKVDFREDSGQARGMEQLVMKSALQRGLGEVSDFEADNRYVYGGALVYTPPLDGLRLGVSYFSGQSDFDFRLGAREADARGTNKDFVVLSMEYFLTDWKLAIEYTEFTGDREVLGIDIVDGRSQGAYVQLCCHTFEPLVLSVLYDVFYADKDDHDGSNFVANGQADFLAWRKDFAVGVRWNISDQLIVKAEHHWLNGAGLQLPLFNPQGVEEDWSYFVLKTSFNF